MSVLLLFVQSALGILLTPLIVDKGLRGLLNLVTQSNFNLRYQLHFALSHFGTYVAALIMAIVFWLAGRILARLLGHSRMPSMWTLLATMAFALGLAHISTLPLAGELETAFYARTFMTMPPFVYPLLGCVIAGLMVRGRHVT